MALVLKDRVKEQTTTTGTGTVTLGGAVSGFDTFASVGDGNTTYYAIVSQSANEWEVGIGTYTASGTTLSRDTILESSNSDSAVNFSAGTKDVFVTYPADKSVYADAAGTVNTGAIAATSLTLTTDLAVADGGTGASSLTDGGVLLGSGTGAITPMAVLTDGQMIVGDGTGDPVAESGATLRTSIGVDAAGTDNSTNVTLAGSLDYLTISGQEITRGAVVLTTDISGTLPIANGGTNATSAGAARTALGAAASGANSDITSITGLTTDLTVAQGGTGAGTFAANGILFGNGTSAIGATAVGTSGHILTSNGSGVAPTFQAAAAGGATDIDGLSDALTNSSGATVGLGTGALAADDGSDNKNTALGYQALNDATTGYNNTALGYQAGDIITTGYKNTTLGNLSAGGLTTGHSNTILGAVSGAKIATGTHNVAVGVDALEGAASMSGSYNIGIGLNSLNKVSSGGQNVALGYDACKAVTTGNHNIALGNQSLYNATTGSENVAIGNNAIYIGGTATTHCVAVGHGALIRVSGNTNTAVGTDAGNTTTSGTNNTFLGNDAEGSSATVSNEITLGNTSVDKFRIPGINFIIKDSTATEDYVLTVDASGEAGWEAAAAGGATDINGLSDAFTSGTSALYLGTDVGNSSTATNTAVGQQSLQSITGASGGVVAFGWKAGKSNAGGYWNTFIGATAADGVTTGIKNVLMGYDVSKTLTTGSSNVIIGSQAAENLSTGSSNTIIGENAGTATATNANCIIMGQGAASSSNSVANEITLGNSSVTSFRIPGVDFYSLSGNVGIGTAAPATKLDVVTAGDNTITSRSTGGAGLFAATGVANAYTGYFINAVGTNLWSMQTRGNDSLHLFRNSGSGNVIVDSGNVGIGTAAPNEPLTVQRNGTTVSGLSPSNVASFQSTSSSTQSSYLSIIAGSSGSSAQAAIFFGDADDPDIGKVLYRNSDDSMDFVVNASSRMKILSSGNVGIGTASPAKQLSITKSALATINTLTDGATITPDFDAGQNFSVTLAGNRTLANPTNIDAGQTGSIFITQDGTGSRTLSFGSYWDFAGGTAPTLSTAAASVDRIDYIVRTGTSIHAVATLNLS